MLAIKIARHQSRVTSHTSSQFFDEGSVVVTGSDDRCVRLWHGSGGGKLWQLLRRLCVHEGRVWGVSAIILPQVTTTTTTTNSSTFTSNNNILVASCGEDGRCCIWDSAGEHLLSNEIISGGGGGGGGGGDVWALEFAGSGSEVFFACGDGTVRSASDLGFSVLFFIWGLVFCFCFASFSFYHQVSARLKRRGRGAEQSRA